MDFIFSLEPTFVARGLRALANAQHLLRTRVLGCDTR
jgi:hypothetical protein